MYGLSIVFPFQMLILHNICILSKDIFDMTWIEDIESELQSWLAQGELREGFEWRGEKVTLKQGQGSLKVAIASIVIFYFLQNQRKSKNIPWFLLLENSTSIFPWIAIKVSTLKSSQLCPFFFFMGENMVKYTQKIM